MIMKDDRNLVHILIMVITFPVALLWTIKCSDFNRDNENYNKARILLQDDLKAVTEDYKGESYDDETVNHKYILMGLDGRVLGGNDTSYKKGQQLNCVTELQTDHAYAEANGEDYKITFPVMVEDEIKAFAVFKIDKDQVSASKDLLIIRSFLPLIFWGVAVIIYLVAMAVYSRRKILAPIKEITESSSEILAGDYTREILQRTVHDKPLGAVEELAYTFELMRDELHEKALREENLKKSQKELMSCMSHDLRTPITTIQAYAEALRDGIYKTEEKRRESLGVIIRKTEVVNRMIAELLDHSNAELNQLRIDRKEQYQKGFFDCLAMELETYCHKNSCEFFYENNCPDMLLNIDAGRITQVVYNLVENACKYMKQQEDSKESPRVQLLVRCQREERRVYISVVDNGPGIEMTDIPYVFNRFYRAEKSRSMQIPGAGLGLAICRYIVKEHQGEINLESRKNKGTEVTFYLGY